MQEELDPFMPISTIDLFRVVPLLMIVSFVCNVYNLIKQAGAEVAMVASLLACLVGLHLGASLNSLLYNPLGRFLHRLEHF